MKLDIIMHYEVDETTGEIKFVGKEEITVDTVASKPAAKKNADFDARTEPIVTLDSNKLILSQGAYDLLQVCEDCRVDIKYKKKDKKALPVIGTDSVFGTKGGTKLTGKLTASFRGEKNDKLSAYGTEFKLEPTEDTGIFYLIGNKETEEVSIPDEIINIEKELDLDDLDNINIDTDEKELGVFDFKF